MKLALIVAMDNQGLIGKNNDLPWRLSADLQYFRRVTMGKPIIMGRKTHESIGRPLPGRKNIVLTTQKGYQAEGCEVVHSVQQVQQLCADNDEIIIIGGSSLYALFLPYADTLYLTRVDAALEGDTWFPAWSLQEWQLISDEKHQADQNNEYDYCFMRYQRINQQ